MPGLNLKRISILLALVFMWGLVFTGSARAVEFTNDGIVAANEVVDDDLFISADQADIDGTVNGDLFINSSQAAVRGLVDGNLIVNSAILNLTGHVTGSVVFFGRSAEISGQIDGSVYASGNGMRIRPEARLARNLFWAGYALDVRPGVEVGRDIILAGYQGQIRPASVRHVSASVSGLELDGVINGNVYAAVEGAGVNDAFMQVVNEMLPPSEMFEPIPMLPSGLRVAPTTQIGGRLDYQSPVNQDSSIGAAPGGGVSFTPAPVDPELTLAERVAAWFIARFKELATLLILGGLVAALFPIALRRSGEQAGARPLRAAWKGLLALVGGFILVALALILVSVVGLLIGIIQLGDLSLATFTMGISGLAALFFFFLFMITFGSKLVAAQWAGQKILARFSATAGDHRYYPVIIGLLIYVALRFIPIVGLLVGLAATLIGLGAAYMAWRENHPEA